MSDKKHWVIEINPIKEGIKIQTPLTHAEALLIHRIVVAAVHATEPLLYDGDKPPAMALYLAQQPEIIIEFDTEQL